MADLNLSEQFGLDTVYGANAERQIIKEITIASDASVDFVHGVDDVVIDSTFDKYIIEIIDLVPGTDSVALDARLSDDLGVTWESGGNYFWAGYYHHRANGAGSDFQDSDTSIGLTSGATMGNATAEERYSAVVEFLSQSGGSPYGHYRSNWLSQASTRLVWNAGSWILGNSAMSGFNGIQILPSSGVLTSGKIKLIGLK